MRQILLVAFLMTLVGACRQEEEDAPAKAYRDFADAENQGDFSRAWSLLSHATQELLTAHARTLAQARGAPPPDDGRDLAFEEDLRFLAAIKSVTAVEQEGDRATLAVTDDKGGHQTIHVIREQDRWRVDLSHELGGR